MSRQAATRRLRRIIANSDITANAKFSCASHDLQHLYISIGQVVRIHLNCVIRTISEERCKFLSVRQRIAVAKLARSNPQASGTEVRRALQRFSPNSKVEASMVLSVHKLVTHQKRKERAASCFGIRQWKLCPMSKEHCPMCHLVSFFQGTVG